MIIRFENLDNPSYSAQFTFNNNGFVCAEYDYSDFFDVVDPDLSSQNSFSEFLDKIGFDIFTDDFVGAYSGNQYHMGEGWHSFKINFTYGDYRKIYREGFNSWVQGNFDSINTCSCSAAFDTYEDFNNCPDNIYDDFVSDSWTSSYCLKFSQYYEPLDKLYISYCNYLDFDGDSIPCYYKGFLPTISFIEPDINYPHFKIYAYDFSNFSNEDCKYSLFLHVFYLDSNNVKKIKTLKVGSFGVFQGNFYFENFYGNKVDNFVKRYFDFYTFFNTNTIDNVSDFMNDNFNNFNTVNINSFGEAFVFELKKEDYSGVYMATLDCECLTNAINSLNNRLDNFNKSFSEAFNKVPVSGQQVFGSGSVFKSNDLDNYDYYYLMDNKGKSCDNPLNVNFCPFTFSEVPIRINSIPALDVDIDSMPTTRLVTHLNNAVDISCICDELDDIDKGLVAEFSAQGVLLTSIVTSINELAKKFVTGCDTTFGAAFSEAFNLTNCVGSVFKANDLNWSDEDTLAGILYKALDYQYNYDHPNFRSPFVYSYQSGNTFSLSMLLKTIFCKGGTVTDSSSVFKTAANFSVSDLFRNAFFINGHGAQSTPTFSMSVFSSDYKNENNKILYHGCDNNPCNIAFCEDVPLEMPTPEVTITNNVPVPSVDVEVAAPSVTVNNSVPEAPVIPDNIYINADGKTFLNNNNFK